MSRKSFLKRTMRVVQWRELLTETDKQTEHYLHFSIVSTCLKLTLPQAVIWYHYTDVAIIIIIITGIQNEKMTPTHLMIMSQHPTWRAAYITLTCSTSHSAYRTTHSHETAYTWHTSFYTVCRRQVYSAISDESMKHAVCIRDDTGLPCHTHTCRSWRTIFKKPVCVW